MYQNVKKIQLLILSCLFIALTFGSQSSLLAGAKTPIVKSDKKAGIKALIITGRNNHDWCRTSPILKQMLEDSGLFSVDLVKVETDEETRAFHIDFKPYDVLVLDYNHYVGPTEIEEEEEEEHGPGEEDAEGDGDGEGEGEEEEEGHDDEGEGEEDDEEFEDDEDDWVEPEAIQWPDATKKAFVEYVKNGGGVVSYHAANNAFGGWKEYNEIIGLGGWGGRTAASGPYLRWRDGKVVIEQVPGPCGEHGEKHDFLMVNRNTEHPITKGLPEKWMHAFDELYDHLRGPAMNITLLSTAFSKDSNNDEPILWTVDYGKGRCFHTTLGHVWLGEKGVPALECVGFITTFLRGTEWAATGKVTQEVPKDFPTEDKISRWSGFKPPK